jgi:hypothetical protein
MKLGTKVKARFGKVFYIKTVNHNFQDLEFSVVKFMLYQVNTYFFFRPVLRIFPDLMEL